MYNNLRLVSYADSYLKTLLDKYRHNFRYIPVTYYKWNDNDSTIDRALFKNGNWQPFGTWSGMLWYKILFFPLANIETITRQTTGNEYGVYNQPETYATVPYINFKPTTYDFVLFSFDGRKDEVLYQVVNVEQLYKDTQTDTNIFRVKLISTGYTETDIDSHLSNIYAYNESTDKIYTLDDFDTLVTAYDNVIQLLPQVNRIIPNLSMRDI